MMCLQRCLDETKLRVIESDFTAVVYGCRVEGIKFQFVYSRKNDWKLIQTKKGSEVTSCLISWAECQQCIQIAQLFFFCAMQCGTEHLSFRKFGSCRDKSIVICHGV